MVSYKDLGLVNSRDMFAKAIKGGYAVPAYNFNNMEQMQAIIQACVATKSPVILQVSRGARDYANINILRNMARGVVEYAHELGCDIPIVLHLDHGDSYETCKECIDNGFSSVMIDGSSLPYEENVRGAVCSILDVHHDQRARGIDYRALLPKFLHFALLASVRSDDDDRPSGHFLRAIHHPHTLFKVRGDDVVVVNDPSIDEERGCAIPCDCFIEGIKGCLDALAEPGKGGESAFHQSSTSE